LGFDQHGHDIACPGASWTASGGEIDTQGRFTAGVIGAYQIHARVESLEAFAQAGVADEIPPDPKKKKGISWRGSVPPQKWMNFYTKVLSSLVSQPGLQLEVRFVVPPSDSTTEAKIEAIKTALRELGLSEETQDVL
jgi:hypothetical protein